MNNKVVTKTSTEFGSVRCVEEKGQLCTVHLTLQKHLDIPIQERQ